MQGQGARTRRTFELVGGHAALDLVNTLDWRFRADGQEELLTNFDDLVDFAEQAQLLTFKQAKQLTRTADGPAGDRVLADTRALREALSDVVYAGIDRKNPSTSSLPTLERFFRTSSAHTRLVRDGGGLKWDWAADAESAPEFPLWILTRAASHLMLSDSIDRVRSCSNPACRWLFLDTSKNQTRRWCDMKICGNRMKARRFRASHAAD